IGFLMTVNYDDNSTRRVDDEVLYTRELDIRPTLLPHLISKVAVEWSCPWF
ncbi:hypothetical protein NHX12_031267, partial [Muraenolepis orangiensis]